MKCINSLLAFVFVASALLESEAFTPNPRIHAPLHRTQSSTALNAFAFRQDTEDGAMQLMLNARECAFSDSCSIDDASYYLREVMRVESGCVAGTLAGQELCDVSFSTEIVANLRAKLDAASSLTKPALLNPTAQLVSISTLALFMAVMVSTSHVVGEAAAPFTLQEWWWAAKDGYLPDMVHHLFKNGGLAAAEFDGDAALSFTLQEWWWSLKGGYIQDMVHHYAVNGGLAAVNVDGETATAPFTLQEWGWAAKGGYFPQMIHHYAVNGGLAAVDGDSAAAPFTLQEWVWATREGYLPQMIHHNVVNGGV